MRRREDEKKESCRLRHASFKSQRHEKKKAPYYNFDCPIFGMETQTLK